MKYYEEHEAAYQELLKNGYVGWDRKRTVDELLSFPFRPELERLVTTCSWGVGPKALDIGSGTGPVALYLASKGMDALGIDVSLTAVTKAREIAARLRVPARFIWGDFLTSLFPRGCYHLVVDSAFLQCMVFDEDRAMALTRIHRLMEVDGLYVLYTQVADRPVDLGLDYQLDTEGVLWHISDKRTADARVHGSKWAAPRRRILSSDVVREELRTMGFSEIKYRILNQDQPDGPLFLYGVYSK